MHPNASRALAACLLALMFFLAGGAALRESPTVDEIAHVGAGLSYLQRFDLRLNPEHPPLGKALAAIPLALLGTHADYSSPAWTVSSDFFPAYGAQWIFGDAVLGRWNPWRTTLLWARFPMLVLTLLLGWCMYRYATRIGGPWGGVLCLAAYATTPAFLVFGPLVITDLPVTLFTVIALWRLGEVWIAPTRRNALLLGLAVAAALLSKFTGLLLLPVIAVLFVQTRFWPTVIEPLEKHERKTWRKARSRCVLRALLWAALFVYAFYFIFSWNQPNDALNRIGGGPEASLIRRPLMPLWLYSRGLLFMLATASRPTYLFGRVIPHGVPYYFPIVFALKSTLGFLLLLGFAALLGIVCRRRGIHVIPEGALPHWRVLNVGFFVYLAVCLLSRLDISIRHFLVPVALLILMLAPLARILKSVPHPRLLQAATLILVIGCFVPILAAYPYFFPFVNRLAFGRPAYYLLNDSNVSWNEALPELERFVRGQHLAAIGLDWASLSDPAVIVPEARAWDCQAPAAGDAGQWVAVAAVSILENHNCGYLQRYPRRQLAGGSFYVFKLPAPIPPDGAPGGPPPPSARRIMWGTPFDLRAWSLNAERHPDQLVPAMHELMRRFQQQANKPPTSQPPR
jgi:4-amino-4-deoxy-L-arabinose transferase-like glycosyltransferase